MAAEGQQHEHRYVPLGEGADYAGIPIGTVRDWIRRGILPGYRIGPRLLQVNLDDIDELRHRVPAVQPRSQVKAKKTRT
jgi:excisionase family DNA binding protein